ncbi:serine/threonine protein kinase [Marseillevirus marseillevirus]|uniref:Serine/threonine protein kinase n=1 Tax=Marseillevirus marseillevirus TaxID=694581 RepID=D2XA92_GBMV|nr:serine/threonine protein kinase [Marseillevirus marseillevirus]ADB03869.1 serine/threonine protein kinase [Marseillevirus marseillevirus]
MRNPNSVEIKPHKEPLEKFSISWGKVLQKMGKWRDSEDAEARANLLAEFCKDSFARDSEDPGLSEALQHYDFEWFKFRSLSDLTMVSELGKGTFGHVYKVFSGERHFALKLFDVGITEKGNGDSMGIGGLLDFHFGRYEARCMLDLTLQKKGNLPLPKFYDFGFTAVGGKVRTYILMEYLEGETLWQMTKNGKRVGDIEKLSEGIFSAVFYLHLRGYSHSDISPANIFVTSSEEVKLIDLGSACDVNVTVFEFLSSVNPPENFAKPPEHISMLDQFRNDLWCAAYCVVYAFGKRKGLRNFPQPKRESFSEFLDDLALSMEEIQGETLPSTALRALSINPEERRSF